jgi:hypothetical protein
VVVRRSGWLPPTSNHKTTPQSTTNYHVVRRRLRFPGLYQCYISTPRLPQVRSAGLVSHLLLLSRLLQKELCEPQVDSCVSKANPCQVRRCHCIFVEGVSCRSSAMYIITALQWKATRSRECDATLLNPLLTSLSSCPPPFQPTDAPQIPSRRPCFLPRGRR